MRSKITVIGLLALVAVFFGVMFWLRSLVVSISVPVEKALGAAPPRSFKAFGAYETPDGMIAELTIPTPPAMVRVVRLTNLPAELKVTPMDIATFSSALPAYAKKYFGAHISAKRISSPSESQFSINGREISVATFSEKTTNNYLAMVIDNRDSNGSLCLVSVMRKDSPVDPQSILSELVSLPCGEPRAKN